VTFSNSESTETSHDDYEQSLVKLTEKIHGQHWERIETKPPWKLVLSVPKVKAPEDKIQVDAVFAWHHALSDGLSGAAFHRSLYSELQKTCAGFDFSKPEANWDGSYIDSVLDIPSSLYDNFLEPVEKTLDIRPSYAFVAKVLFKGRYCPAWLYAYLYPDEANVWTAKPVFDSDPALYKSRAKFVEIPAPLVSEAIVACRNQKATLTGLMTGIIIAALRDLVPEAVSFTSEVPFTLRRASGISMDEMICHVSGMQTNYSAKFITLGKSIEDETRQKEIWELAREYGKRMDDELSDHKLHRENETGLLEYAGDTHAYVKRKLGKKRGQTFEISNLGVAKMAKGSNEGNPWTVERMVFTQPGMVISAAVSFNCATIPGGPMMVSLTWQDGVVEDGFVDELATKLKTGLSTMSKLV
jgi:Alcohol acetyltransferase